jgi:tetratricopeptide (TPR) repeat protein
MFAGIYFINSFMLKTTLHYRMRNTFQILLLSIILLICSNNSFAQAIDSYKNKGDALFAGGLFQNAVDNYDKAIKKGGVNKIEMANLYYKLGLSQDSLKQYDEAIKSYTSSISSNPQVADVYWSRGVIYDTQNTEYQLAINDYLKTIKLINNNNEALSKLNCNVASDELQIKELAKAMTADSLAIALDPYASRPYWVRGSIHNARNEYQLAIDDFTNAIKYADETNPKKLSALYAARARSKNLLKKYKDAINDFSYAILLNDQNRIAYWDRAASYHYNGDYLLAAADYTKAMAFYQGSKTSMSKLYDDRAVNEMWQTLLTPAIQDDSVALALDPNNRSAYLNQSIAYTQNGDYQKSVDRYNQLFNFANDNKLFQAFIYFQIANNEYFLGEFDKVITDCSRSLAIDSNNSSSYFYRAKVYLKKINNKTLALNDFNRVLTLDTSKKTVNYIFSTFYTGDGDKAIAILKNNLLNAKENSGQLSAYYNLACLYSLMNKPDEAITYLKIAIDKGYSKKYINADEDLDNIRKTDEYKAMMNNSVAAN